MPLEFNIDDGSSEILILVEPDGPVDFYDSSAESPMKESNAHNQAQESR